MDLPSLHGKRASFSTETELDVSDSAKTPAEAKKFVDKRQSNYDEYKKLQVRHERAWGTVRVRVGVGGGVGRMGLEEKQRNQASTGQFSAHGS